MAKRSKRHRRRNNPDSGYPAPPPNAMTKPAEAEDIEVLPASASAPPTENEALPPPSRRWASRLLLVLAILMAWGAGAWVRAEWVRNANKPEHADYQWRDGYLLTTHDSFFYASVIEQGTAAQPDYLVQHPDIYHQGLLTILGAVLVKLGFSVPALTTWLPVILAPLLAVPVVLIGRLYGSTLWGCCAALVAVLAASYFSRTTPGYFDTDMLAVTWPMMVLYLLLRAHRETSRNWLVTAALALMFYPFAYGSGASVVIAMALCFMGLQAAPLVAVRSHPLLRDFFKGRYDEAFSWDAILLTAIAGLFCVWTPGGQLVKQPGWPLLGVALLGGAWFITHRHRQQAREPGQLNRMLRGAAVFFVALMLYVGGPWHVVKQTLGYLPSVKAKVEQWMGSAQAPAPTAPTTPQPLPNLKFQEVKATIVEVAETPFFSVKENPQKTNIALRVSGSDLGFGLALIGLALLLVLHPEFLIGAPLLGIGIYLAHIAGHRFTIHAVPLAALGATYIPFGIIELARRIAPGQRAPGEPMGIMPIDKLARNHPRWFAAWAGAGLLTLTLTFVLLKPNYDYDIAVARGRPPVLRAAEVEQLAQLRKISKPGDYVLAWWDYGSAIWLYSGRNVLTSPYNQSHDNYIIAKILNSNSQALAANLARLAVEIHHQDGPPQGGELAVQQIFRSPTQSPSNILEVLEHPGYPVPAPTRDVYLYLPAQMLPIFPVLHQFSERDLLTGKSTSRRPDFFEFTAWQPIGNNSHAIAIGEMHVDGKSMSATAFCDLEAHLYIQKTPLHPPFQPKTFERLQLPYLSIETRDGQRHHCNLRHLSLQHNQALPTHPHLVFQDHRGRHKTLAQKDILAAYPALPLKSVEIVNPNPQRPGHVHIQRFNPNDNPHRDTAGHHLVFSNENGFAYLMATASYESNYIQMFLLGQHDPQFFTPVISGAQGRIYRVKQR